MTLPEIKAAVLAGKRVYWVNPYYQVIHDKLGQWFIWCVLTDHYIGLTWRDGVTMNGREHEFFVDEREEQAGTAGTAAT